MSEVETPRRIVVMGVSAVGKSTVGVAMAGELGYAFVDADDLHPPANRAKMAAGVALTDEDRWPWLELVGHAMSGSTGVVVACSALRRVYRDRIRDAAPDTFFVFLTGDPLLLKARAAARRGHFMPATLLDSQFATLEPLGSDERGVQIDVTTSPVEVERQALAALCAEPT